ncbi:hypothetical protein QYF50_10830 [Paenibacillus vini]|uniref:hypothetical protein n=1 Tax=Paenibacillus vini TaxID=1476024 RepID=UPI0025B64DD5|nr:hypothetical protein [Paenibacillus vini]MDN4068384.1 hypothetical protein [Paenibacillus vini]
MLNQKVDPDQIKGLANHMERLRMGIGESTANVYRDISQLIRDTRSAYSESSVQAAVNEVDRVPQEIRKLSQSIDDRLGSKAKTLRRVAQDYVRVEKEAEQKIQSAMKTVQLRAGNSVELNKRVQKVVKVKTVESLDDVKPNDANLKMLLRQFLDEFGYEVMPGEVSVDITMDEHVLDFWEFALAKGYDPVTYDYLEYWERSEAYRRLEEKINELRSAQESYKESMLDGYEVLAFGKGFYIGLDNSINNIADKFAEIVSHPVASGEALLQGIKQVYINLNEEAGKFSKDPLSYIRKAAVNKWASLKDVYVELQELKPSQRWERIGGMVGENIIAAATSAVGGGIVGAGLKKVFIIIESKIDINIPIKDIDKITGNETKPPSELQSPDVTKPPKAVEAPQTPEVNKSIEGTGNVTTGLGTVQSRINIANGRTRFTPLRDTGEPVSAGFDHILEGHFNRPLANSRSIFSIAPDKLKEILQSSDVVKSTVTDIGGGQFTRTVNVGEVVGNSALKYGGGETTWIKIFTDKAGNLITTYPVPAP